MTAITSSNTTTSANELTPPLKVALTGLTMIQQSLLEFYFETKEGKKQYVQVLGKDADAYITNFDESGSTEAWENLYAHEKKPTLVLSNHHKTIDNYIYIPKPITPIALESAFISLNKLLDKKLSISESSDFLAFSIDHHQNDTDSIDTLLTVTHEENIPTPSTIIPEEIKNELEIFPSFEDQEAQKDQQNFSELVIPNLDDLNLEEEKPASTQPSFEETIKTEEINTTDIDLPIKPAEKDEFDEASLSFIDNIEEPKLNSDMPSDDLEALLSELSQEDAKQKEQTSTSEDKPVESKKSIAKKKTKEEKRWDLLCGEYDDISYKISTPEETHFKAMNTLFSYLKDTIDFSKRSSCWMEVSYKYLSITIDPENKRIYSNISLEDKNFVYLCIKDMDEDQIELEEIDEQGITQFKQNKVNKKHFDYSFKSFLWTTSLITSHGRLPDEVNPDNKISINNWLSLKEVEKFPHIMQIAAVFNQHNASLNEVATWMNLPKRYVYAFYNGVEALNMIEKDSEKSNKESLISMKKEEKESTFKKILFTKIM